MTIELDKLYINQRIRVKSWWTQPKGKPIWCIITHIPSKNHKYLTVKPLEGYIHERMILPENIIETE